MHINNKGFISTFFLYYFLVISIIIASGYVHIQKNIATIENIDIYQQQLKLLSKTKSLITCSLKNKKEQLNYSDENGSIDVVIDYENEIIYGQVCALYCNDLNITFENSTFSSIDLN